MPNLSLSVTRSNMRIVPHPGHGARSDRALAEARNDVLGQSRFARRCVFCDYQFGRVADECEVFHLDGDHGNDALDNLAPACVFCHAPAHLDLASKRWPDDPGLMVWLPELTQPEVSSLMQAIVFACAMQATDQLPDQVVTVAQSTGLPIAPHAVYMRLSARAAQVEAVAPGEAKVREGMSSPRVLARVLQAMSPDDYARRDELLAGVRYLPPLQPFLEQARHWPMDGGAFSHLDLGSWAALNTPSEGSRGG